MGKIVVELTNRCNLSCQHCYSGRHGGRDELSLDTFRRIVAEAKHSGFTSFGFTGGEPTLHRSFDEILRLSHDAGYRFGFVTNGWNFTSNYRSLREFGDQLDGLAFSLDGGTAATHDGIRGTGSYRRVMQAMSVCMVEQLRFTINMVVTGRSRGELQLAADTAMKLGASGLRFCHFFPETDAKARALELPEHERKQVDREVEALAKRYSIPIAMAPGFHTSELFPCAPLQMREVNVDWRGNLTKCCHLSGDSSGATTADVAGAIAEIGFAEALGRLTQENTQFRRRKVDRERNGALEDGDYFPCHYCSRYYGKAMAMGPGRERLWQVAPRPV